MPTQGSLEKHIVDMIVDRASDGTLTVNEILALHMMGIHPDFYEIEILYNNFTEDILMLMYNLGHFKFGLLECAVLSTKIFTCELTNFSLERKDETKDMRVLKDIVDDLEEIIECGFDGQPAVEAYNSLVYLQGMMKNKYRSSRH